VSGVQDYVHAVEGIALLLPGSFFNFEKEKRRGAEDAEIKIYLGLLSI